jgi:hypothetical protein
MKTHHHCSLIRRNTNLINTKKIWNEIKRKRRIYHLPGHHGLMEHNGENK